MKILSFLTQISAKFSFFLLFGKILLFQQNFCRFCRILHMKRFFLFSAKIFLFSARKFSVSVIVLYILSAVAETLGKSKTFRREIFTDFLRFPLMGAVDGVSYIEGLYLTVFNGLYRLPFSKRGIGLCI